MIDTYTIPNNSIVFLQTSDGRELEILSDDRMISAIFMLPEIIKVMLQIADCGLNDAQELAEKSMEKLDQLFADGEK